MEIEQTVTRISNSNSRVTKGKTYKVYWDDKGRHILDDNGDRMKPTINASYWRKETKVLLPAKETHLPTPKKETKMSKITIEEVTLLNGINTKEYSIDDLLAMIEQEQKQHNRLNSLTFSSIAIDKLKIKHETNIEKLIALLDKIDIED